jgi:predicted dehydrogenase
VASVGVGIVGLSTRGGWAARSHVPALSAVPGLELRAVLGSGAAATTRTADAYGIAAAASVGELAARPDVDLVVVSVRVPQHHDVIRAAAGHGVGILSEWPLAIDRTQAAGLVAATTGTPTFVGLQGRSGPAVRHVRDLVEDRFVGEVLSTSIIASGTQWGATVAAGSEYLLDRSNGATMLTIPFGHLLDTVQHVLGGLVDVQAVTSTRRRQVTVTPDGHSMPMTAADQIAVIGTLQGGAVASFHYRGGRSSGTDFLWEINGSRGDLRITAGSGHLQLSPCMVWSSRGGADLAPVTLPTGLDLFPALAGQASHQIAHSYAQVVADLRTGSACHPDFVHALRLHDVLAAIQTSADTGRRITLAEGAWATPLPR